MDGNGALFVLFMVACGLVGGYVVGRQQSAEELETLRGIVRDNQENNVKRMEAVLRGKRNDKTK